MEFLKSSTFLFFIQVSQLKLELSTRSAELQASELRLQNMEKDLVDLSLSNENYRSQVSHPRAWLILVKLQERFPNETIIIIGGCSGNSYSYFVSRSNILSPASTW